MQSVNKQAGFSLIEVLVAMVVLSIGMLGIAALYVDTLRDSGSAILRTRAIVMAGDMADRIRANINGGADYVVATGGTGDGTHGCAETGLTATPPTAAANCTPTQMAEHDIFFWKQTLVNAQTGLPNGLGAITRDTGTTPPTYTITITWDEIEGSVSYTLAFQM